MPLSLGSDTGGSIRQPAALCGTVGVKPTYGAVSRLGLIAFGSSLDQIGPFATTVDDAALALEVISGHDPADSTSIEQLPLDLRANLQMGVAGVACRPDHRPPQRAPAQTSRRGLTRRLKRWADAGADIVDVEVPAFGYGLTAYYLIAPAEASSNLARFDGVRFGTRVAAPRHKSDVHGHAKLRVLAQRSSGGSCSGPMRFSAGYYDAYYGRAQKIRRLIAGDFAAAYAKVDVLLTPAISHSGFRDR